MAMFGYMLLAGQGGFTPLCSIGPPLTQASLQWQPFIELASDNHSHEPYENNDDHYPILLLDPPPDIVRHILVGGRIDREPVEFWTSQRLTPGYSNFVAPVVVGGARILFGLFHEHQEQTYSSRLLSRSRGEDRFLHRTLRGGLQSHETPEPAYTTRFLRKGVGEDRFLHRTLTPGLQRHDIHEPSYSQFFLRKGVGEDRGIGRLLVQRWGEEPPTHDVRGTILSFGSFVPAAPPQDRIQLLLMGTAPDAFVFEDYAVHFPAKFIHVGSDFTPPVAPGTPMVWHFLARRRGRWGR